MFFEDVFDRPAGSLNGSGGWTDEGSGTSLVITSPGHVSTPGDGFWNDYQPDATGTITPTDAWFFELTTVIGAITGAGAEIDLCWGSVGLQDGPLLKLTKQPGLPAGHTLIVEIDDGSGGQTIVELTVNLTVSHVFKFYNVAGTYHLAIDGVDVATLVATTPAPSTPGIGLIIGTGAPETPPIITRVATGIA